MKRLITFSIVILTAIFLVQSPVFADAVTSRGTNGGGAPMMLSISSKGIAFLLIWIIEAIIFRRILDITWGRAIFGSLILNLWSSIWGVILAVAAFSWIEATWWILGGYAILTIRIFYVRADLPKHFVPILLGSLAVGSVFVYQTAGFIPPLSPFLVYIMMLVPLLIGFGISIMFETLISSKVLGGPESWKGILKANITSYILLALMIPFYSDNIYDDSDDPIQAAIIQRMAEGADSAEITDILNHYAAPTSWLLGFSIDSNPRGEHWAGMERDILTEAYTADAETWPDPAYGLAIAEEVLSYPELYEQSREEFEWLEDYFGYWNSVSVADEAGNQQEFISVSLQWTIWYQTSDVPNYLDELPDPADVMASMNESGETDRDESTRRGSGGK